MSLSDMIAEIQERAQDNLTDPVEHEFCGTVVMYEDHAMRGNMWSEWEPVLEKWMPRFDEAGWLDEFEGLYLGDSYRDSDDPNSQGEYRPSSKSIAFPQKPSYVGPDWLVSDTIEYALLHEMTHHVHIRDTLGLDPTPGPFKFSARQKRHDFDMMRPLFDGHVSGYSASNYLEAVAETSAGMMLGNEYEEVIYYCYSKLGGPRPVANEPESLKSYYDEE